MREVDRSSDGSHGGSVAGLMFPTALVGHGLTAAAQGESPTVGLGAETGERVAKPEPLHRTSGESRGSEGNV